MSSYQRTSTVLIIFFCALMYWATVSITQASDVNITATVIHPSAPPASSSPTPAASPSASPTPSFVPTPTPEPSVEPTTTPEPSVSPSPSPEPTPIEEIQKTVEKVVETISANLKKVDEELKKIAPIIEKTAFALPALTTASAAMAIAVPLQTALAVSGQVSGSGFSLEIFSKVLQALGLYRGGTVLGLVFNSKTGSPVPFALITLQGKTQSGEEILETLVSDAQGFYRGIKLPPGRYTFAVRHQDYLFPSSLPRPKYLGVKEFYQGEVFVVINQTELHFFNIPIDPLRTEKETHERLSYRLGILNSVIKRFVKSLTIPLFIYSGIVAYLFPSTFNFVILALYTLLFIRTIYKMLRPPNVKGLISNTINEPLQDTLVRLSQLGSSTYGAVALTNSKGLFSTRIKPGVYKFSATKLGYVGIEGQEAMTEYEVDTRKCRQKIDIRLEPVGITSQDIFG